ncbi:MAG TPA: hypothetical protein ENI99_06985 [Sedimenticola sp.]|nr:hypothetical protein [Sedimenticola sp.]
MLRPGVRHHRRYSLRGYRLPYPWDGVEISCQLSVVSYQLSVVSYQLSVVSCQLSVVRKVAQGLRPSPSDNCPLTADPLFTAPGTC